MQAFQLPRLLSRDSKIERIARFLAALSPDKGWTVEVKEHKRRRSDAQNRYLWGVCYPAILAHLEGWTAEDVHEYCLGECFGWEKLEGLGRAKVKPIRRSKALTVTEFMDYVAWIQRDMAGRGVYVPDPNQEALAA